MICEKHSEARITSITGGFVLEDILLRALKNKPQLPTAKGKYDLFEPEWLFGPLVTEFNIVYGFWIKDGEEANDLIFIAKIS